VFAGLNFATRDVNVEVVKGTVTLRGQVATPEQQDRLIAEVEKVPGVSSVRSFLHLPGVVAPNKEAAVRSST
jgi:osmotically-inducible protein OsmY